MNTHTKVKLDCSYIIGIEHPQMGSVELNMTAPPDKVGTEADAVEKLLRKHFTELLKEIRKIRRC